jgi:hypothetical protein
VCHHHHYHHQFIGQFITDALLCCCVPGWRTQHKAPLQTATAHPIKSRCREFDIDHRIWTRTYVSGLSEPPLASRHASCTSDRRHSFGACLCGRQKRERNGTTHLSVAKKSHQWNIHKMLLASQKSHLSVYQIWHQRNHHKIQPASQQSMSGTGYPFDAVASCPRSPAGYIRDVISSAASKSPPV